jgi:hypothetical protein
MRTKLFTFTKDTKNTVIASVRIARYVSRELGVPIVTDDTVADGATDLLIIVNGAYAFCKSLAALGAAIEKARRVVWIQNDYTIIPPKKDVTAESPFRKAFRNRYARKQPDTDFWTTCADWEKLTPGSLYVNWNALAFDDEYDEKFVKRRRREAGDDLFYYGSWRCDGGRGGRKTYFDRYFASPGVPLTISTPAKQFEKYASAKVTPRITECFYEEVGSHGAGLYLEDRMSHERYHSPANRFYEMLSAGLPILFQPECGTTMRKAGYDPEGFYCASTRGLPPLLKQREEIGAEQRRLWAQKALDEKRQITKRLRAALAKVEDTL